jgi:hypothetical protein
LFKVGLLAPVAVVAIFLSFTVNAEAALRMLFLVMTRKKVSGIYVLWGMFFSGLCAG